MEERGEEVLIWVLYIISKEGAQEKNGRRASFERFQEIAGSPLQPQR